MFATLYTAYLASMVGYGIWNSLLARHRAAAVVPFTLLIPPVGIASAWLIQHERPGAAEIAGGVVLLAGVAVTVFSAARARKAETVGNALTSAASADTDEARPVTV